MIKIFIFLFSLSAHAGFDSLILSVKLISIENKMATIEYNKKKFQVPVEQLQMSKSTIPGEKVKLAVSPAEFDFIEK